MSSIDSLGTGLKHVESLLGETVLEPDLARTDWHLIRARVTLVEDSVQRELVDGLDDVLFEVNDAETRGLIRSRVGGVLGRTAVLLLAVGNRARFFSLVRKGAELASDEANGAELDAASAEPQVFAHLVHGRWLQDHSKRKEGDRVLKNVIRETKKPAFAAAAKRAIRRPTPVTSAPALFRLNGCGVGLYGERDRWQDGFYIATYCICVLFIPLLPLAAYRVRRSGPSSYQFLAKEHLSGFARAWQLVLLGAGALAIGWGGITTYLDSPTHKSSVAMEAARKLEKAGQTDAALEAYLGVVHTYASQGGVDLDPAVLAVIRISADRVADPCSADSITAVNHVVNAFYDIPQSARAGLDTRLFLAKHLETWADEMGDKTPADASAALSVIDMAARVAKDSPEALVIDKKGVALRRSLADRVIGDRPLRALSLYMQDKPDEDAVLRAKTILDAFGDAPSLWIEAEHDVETWIGAASPALRPSVQTKLGLARTAHAEDVALVQQADEKKLAAALAKVPLDQEIAVAIAALERGRGDLKGALATLTTLGAPGRLTGDAQQLLAACFADAGDLGHADSVLTAFLEERLAGFQQAQREYSGAADQVQQRLIATAKIEGGDPDLESRFRGVTGEDEQRKVFRTWLTERIEGDSTLAALKAEYLRHGAVVPASLALGTIKLRRANAAASDERRALLDASEKVFLSIRTEASGDPSFHLGLGQVYHRMGRDAEGDAEFAHVLEMNDPEMSLAVARTYRELGLSLRAQSIAEGVYNAAGTPTIGKQEAAQLLAYLVGDSGFHEDEEEMWLSRSDPKNTSTSSLILEIEARKLTRQGKFDEADRTYKKLLDIYDKQAEHNPVAGNNAAMAYLARYGISGDPAHLGSAVRELDAAVRLSPENALTTKNLASALEQLGMVTVLDHWVKTRTLFLSRSDADSLLGLLAAGPLHDDVAAALRQDPSIRRSLDVYQRAQVLAPQNAEAYRRRARIYHFTGDTQALARLAKDMETLPAFDTQAVAEERRSWETKAKDAAIKVISEQGIARRKDTVERATHADAPTLATARMLLGEGFLGTIFFEGGDGAVDAALEVTRKARDGWREGGMDAALTGILVTAGLQHSLAECPPLQKAWEAEARIYGLVTFLDRAMNGPDGAVVLAALRKRPEFAEAARLQVENKDKFPDLLDVVLAEIVGGADVEALALAARQREELGNQLAIEAKLNPGFPEEAAELELFKRAPKRL